MLIAAGICAGIVLFLVFSIPAVLLNAWALSELYALFLVPVFFLPPLPYEGALGVALVINFMTYHYRPEPAEKEGSATERFWTAMAYAYARPFLVVGIAHIYLAIWPL